LLCYGHAVDHHRYGGGSNGSRLRLWKIELQCLATELGIDIVVRHLPPGTSKWNKIALIAKPVDMARVRLLP